MEDHHKCLTSRKMYFNKYKMIYTKSANYFKLPKIPYKFIQNIVCKVL